MVLNVFSTRSILPDSILEKSRISLIIDKRVSPADLIFPAYSLIALSGSLISIISFIPIIALIGVLISWLILARKLDFNWLALSA